MLYRDPRYGWKWAAWRETSEVAIEGKRNDWRPQVEAPVMTAGQLQRLDRYSLDCPSADARKGDHCLMNVQDT
jgi:hypothetical protein